ncbi:MAG: PEP-CTERM sorting domain-containing protein [Planctomycetota bacterium]
MSKRFPQSLTLCLGLFAACWGASSQAAIVETIFEGEVDRFVGTDTTALEAAFPAQTAASFILRYDDAFPVDPFNPGVYPSAGTLIVGVDGELFRVDGATLFASGTSFGPGLTFYGLGLEAGTGSPSGTGQGFTITGIDNDDFSVAATGTGSATTDAIEVIEAFDALGDNSPLTAGEVRLSFDDANGDEAGAIVFNISEFVSSNVPEPGSLALLGLGSGLLALRRR